MSFNITYPSFIPPPISSLSFTTNCTLVGEWAGTWFSGQLGVNDDIADRYFRTALPASMRTIPSRGQIIDWMMWGDLYYRQKSTLQVNGGWNVFENKTLAEPLAACPVDFCQGLAWEGDADVTGIGIIISYYIQAGLATLYAVCILTEYLLRKQESKAAWFTHAKTQLFFDSIRASHGLFLDATILFSISFVIAAIWAACPPSESISQLMLGTDMAFFTLLAYNLLSLVTSFAFGEAKSSRFAVLVVLIILYLLANILTLWAESRTGLSTWEIDCNVNQRHSSSLVAEVFWALYASGLVAWLIVFALIPKILKKSNRPRAIQYKTWASKNARHFYLFAAVLCGVTMWAYLIIVTIARKQLLSLSGNSNEDSRWTFGQVVALCTWVPIGLELFYLMRYGLTKTLEERVIPPYEVKKDEHYRDKRFPVADPDRLTTNIQRRPTEPTLDGSAPDDEVELLTRVPISASNPTGVDEPEI